MDTYGLIGYPLEHSFSRTFFTEKFAVEGVDAVYCNFSIPRIEDLQDILTSIPGLRGLNVTIPYKQQVIPLLDALTPQARAIGAVNVIKIQRTAEGELRLVGDNSDVIGFVDSIRPLLKPHHRRALVLGTGGAARAVCHGLQMLGIVHTSVSRTKSSGVLTYEELTPELMQVHEVVINATPLGMYPQIERCPPLPYRAITPHHLLYDLVYNPPVTCFLQRGQEQGATVANGAKMLRLQALAAWRMWHED